MLMVAANDFRNERFPSIGNEERPLGSTGLCCIEKACIEYSVDIDSKQLVAADIAAEHRWDVQTAAELKLS